MPPQPFSAILLEGLAPDGGLAVPESYPRLRSGRARRDCAPLGYPRAGVRGAVALHRRHPAARSQGADRPHLHRGDLRQRRDHAGHDARARVCICCARRTVRRSRSRTSRCSCSATCSSTCWPRRRPAQHPRRDLGRHRHLGRVRDARQARHPRLHAVAAGPDEPVPDGADVFARRSQHFQHRDRRRVRRLPGHRQGDERATPRSSAACASAPSIRSTGRASPRRSSTISRPISPRRATTPSRSRSPCPRAISATSSPATSRARWACRSAA